MPSEYGSRGGFQIEITRGKGAKIQGKSLNIPATAAVRFKVGTRLRDAAARSKRRRASKGRN
jgi:hypothetical protein